MATLTSTKIKNTYDALLKASDNDAIGSSAKQITDGLGNGTPLYISTTQIGIGVTPEATYDLHVYSNAKVGGNLTVTGDLTVEGTTTTIDTQTLTVEDPLIEVASNNTSTDAVDIGWYGKYAPSGTTLYAGLFRDTGDSKFKLFRNLEEQPTTTINTSGTGYTKADLVIGGLEATTGDFTDTVTVDGDIEVENSSGFGRIEIGGSSGGYIDLKSPFSDDFDLRLYTAGTNAEINAISGELDITAYTNINLQNQGTDVLTVESSRVLFSQQAVFGNDIKALFGGSSDLQIYHSATGDSYIANNTGDLIINSSGITGTAIKDEDNMASDSASHLATQQSIKAYVDNSVGNSTLAEVLVNGNTTSGTDIAVSNGDDITFVDDSKAIFGTDGDLEIYHYSITDTAQITINGKLDIRANTLQLKNYSGETYFRGASNGAVRLYYDGVEKFITTSTGISVTDTVSATTFSGQLDGTISSTTTATTQSQGDNSTKLATTAYVDSAIGGQDTLSEVLANGNTTGGTDIAVSSGDDITFADNSKSIYGASSDLEIYHNGTNSVIVNNTNNLIITTASTTIINSDATDNELSFTHTNGNWFVKATTSNSLVLGSGSLVADYVTIKGGGVVQLNDYGSGSNTGTAAYNLSVDSSGNIIETAGGVVDGSGTANDVAMWSDSNTLTDAPIAISGNDATFAGNVISNDTFYLENSSGKRWQQLFNGNNWSIRYYNGSSWSADAFTIDTSKNATFAGSVGIGTTSPLEKLNIVETTATAGTFFPVAISGARYQADYGVGIAFRPENNSSSYANKTAIVGSGGGYGYNMADLHFCFNNSTTITDEVSLSDAKVTMKRSGNVGIGTDSPDVKLHTYDSSSSDVVVAKFGSQNYNTGNKTYIELGTQYSDGGSRIGSFNSSGNASNLVFETMTTTSGVYAERMRIDSSGNIAIGTTDPDGKKLRIVHSTGQGLSLSLNSGSGTNVVQFGDTSDSDIGQISYDHTNNFMAFQTNNAERMRIDSSGNATFNGNVGISTTSPTNGKLEVQQTATTAALWVQTGGTTDSYTIADFRTGTNASALAIKGNGNVEIGTGRVDIGTRSYVGSATSTTRLYLEGNSAGHNLAQLQMADYSAGLMFYLSSSTATSRQACQFYNNRIDSSPTFVGSIQINSSSTAFNTSSDYRLKENVVEMTGALDRVEQLKPSRFNFIGHEEIVDGFLAHEVSDIVPEAITGTKDEVDAEGNPVYQGIDQSKLVPLLVGAIKELKAEIETLKAQINN